MKNSKSYDIQFIKLNVRIWIVVRCDNEVNIVLKYILAYDKSLNITERIVTILKIRK